jgi:two-component system, OmpR family, sensor kinase
MLLPPQKGQGVALLCDKLGTVQSVVRDDLGLAVRVPPGASIVKLCDAADPEKIAQFLTALQTLQAVFDWEIFVPWQDSVMPFRFSGVPVHEGFMVLAAYSLDSRERISDELMRINNEQMNTLRSTAKELALQSGRSSDKGHGMFDELTRVNNELANLQRELFRQNIELEKSHQQKNEFLAMAAHDLRNPLGIILNYSEFLEDVSGPHLDEEHREFITIIKAMTEFMVRLLDNLLDVSHFESGQLIMDLKPAGLTELVRHNVALNQVLSAKKQIRMVFHAGAELPPVRLDRGKIEQVLNNLLSNAIKFSHPDTQVTVSLARENQFAVVTIADQGQGIPNEDIEKLFKPFSRTRVKSTGGESSTGLGLSIVRGIVEAHGGTVQVESRVGTGTVFQVRLPLDSAPAHDHDHQ